MTINDELIIDIKHLLGNRWSVKREDLDIYSSQIRRAAGDISKLRESGKGPDGSQVLFPHLPYLLKEEVLISKEERDSLLRLREEAKGYDAVISIGIGGSYLGNQVLFDLFCGPYWNQLTKEERNGYPQVYFAGQNVDPVSLIELSSCISRKSERLQGRRMKVLLLVISKSGTTIEPVTAVRGLKKLLAPVCDIQIMAITDKEKGRIRPLAEKEHFLCFTVPDGIGGRFSVFSQVGLVFASLVGIPIEEFLDGAKMVEEACRSEDWQENPALLLAALKFIAMKEYGITAEVVRLCPMVTSSAPSAGGMPSFLESPWERNMTWTGMWCITAGLRWLLWEPRICTPSPRSTSRERKTSWCSSFPWNSCRRTCRYSVMKKT